jgi:hypothetical protein
MGDFVGNQTSILALTLQNSTQILIINYYNLFVKNEISQYLINLQAQATDVLLIGNFLFAVIPSANQISIFFLSNNTSYLLYNITS